MGLGLASVRLDWVVLKQEHAQHPSSLCELHRRRRLSASGRFSRSFSGFPSFTFAVAHVRTGEENQGATIHLTATTTVVTAATATSKFYFQNNSISVLRISRR